MELRKAALIRIAFRVAGLVFGVVVISCIAEPRQCSFNGKKEACVLGLACGGVAILIAVVFIAFDVATEVMGVAKCIHISTLIGSSTLSFTIAVAWLVCFAYLTKVWRDVPAEEFQSQLAVFNKVAAVLTVSALSSLIWAIVAVSSLISFRRCRRYPTVAV